jgi:hypothetical protein
MLQYFLFFHMTLTQSNDLQVGKLELIACEYNQCELVDRYDTTSGLPGWQAPTDISVRAKGPIPNPELTHRKSYFVTTHPIDSRGVKGIDGNFYPIIPETIQLPNKTRSGFGVHADKNVPGTAGCLGVTNDPDWKRIQEQFTKIAKLGIDKIPLVITFDIPPLPKGERIP